MTQAFESREAMFELAARAVGKVDAGGQRAATMLSVDEIAAMSLALVALGLVPIAPGANAPQHLTIDHKEQSR